MAADEVSICNSALAKLGAARIVALTEGSNEANLCKLRYPDIRDSVLQAHSWKCCIKRTILAPTLEAPAFGYGSSFLLPADYLRQLPADEDTDLYPIENGYILADGDTLNFRYVARVEDVTLYPTYLREVIAHQLAADVCYALTSDAGKQELQVKLAENALRRARFIDSSQSKAVIKDNNVLLKASRA